MRHVVFIATVLGMSLQPLAVFGATFSLVHTEETPGIRSAAIFDMEGDGDDDIAFAAPDGYMFTLNMGEGVFSSQSPLLGYMGTGWGAHDLNNDGFLDLYQGSDDYFDAIIMQEGGAPVNMDFGSEIPVNTTVSRNVLFDDFDGDGNTDLFITTSAFRGRHQWPLYFNGNSDGTFDGTNLIDEILLSTDSGVPLDEFWHDTTHTRAQVPQVGECASEEWAVKQFKGGIARDFDKDGKTDILTSVYADAGYQDDRCLAYATAWMQFSDRGLYYYHNESTPGTPRFSEKARTVFGDFVNGDTAEHWNPYQATPLDYDRDGDLDLFVGAWIRDPGGIPEDTYSVKFFENQGETFADKTAEAGFQWLNDLMPEERNQRSFAAGAPIDFDNDGWTDLIFINRNNEGEGYNHVHVFRNEGNGTFALIPQAEHGLDHGSGRDITFADFNRDGYVDIVVTDGTGGGTDGSNNARIYFNELSNNGNNWVSLDVREADNTFAIGAKVTVYEAGTQNILGYNEVRTDYSYRSKATPRLYFGLGATDAVDIEVEYGGGVYTYDSLDAEELHTLRLEENDGDITEHLNITYTANPEPDDIRKLDIYTSDDLDGAPVIVGVHGGGWHSGTKVGWLHEKPTYFTDLGFVFVSIDYRLSPGPDEALAMKADGTYGDRVRYPIHTQDMQAAAEWIYEHIGEYGGDPHNISLVGHSAGGGIVALAGSDPQFAPFAGTAQAQAYNCVIPLDIGGAYDLTVSAPSSVMFQNAFATPDEDAVEGTWQNASTIHIVDGLSTEELGSIGANYLIVTNDEQDRGGQLSQQFAQTLTNRNVHSEYLAVPYTHEEINEMLGVAGESVMTPVVTSFLQRRCMTGYGGPLLSDFNGDRKVDIFDYNTLVTYFGVVGECGNAADADEDCDVDIFDYNILIGEFGLGV